MPPTFYDVETFEPLPPANVPVRELQPPAAGKAELRTFTAPATMPVPAPYRQSGAKAIEPAGRIERLVPTRERIVAIGGGQLRILGPDLGQQNEFVAPAGLQVDAGRDLILMADVLGSVVGRRTRDLGIALRVNPTFPRGYERWVLYADASSMLVASVELQQMIGQATHVPDITMFEWWSLGDLSKVDPTTSIPAGAEVKAVTYSRTRPLQFAASPATGEPLVLAQPGHLTWLNRALQPAADVALPGDAVPVSLAVDAGGRALLVLRSGGEQRFLVVESGGQRLGDFPLPGADDASPAPVLLPGPGVVHVIAGNSILVVDEKGVAQWRAEFPAAPVMAGLAGREGGLFVACGTRLYHVAAGGHVDLLFESRQPLVSVPLPRDGQVLVATDTEILTLVPVQ